ncbi:MAG: helix-turn-helix domain-containing protein [Verrucomicrobiae bacterium]|nr:helix-turn-helix domain-containing protein [Verrucomicrobiae bacterium]
MSSPESSSASPAQGEWLSPAEWAAKVGVSRASVYRYIAEGDIPQTFVIYAGRRRIRLAAASLPYCLALWRSRRGE